MAQDYQDSVDQNQLSQAINEIEENFLALDTSFSGATAPAVRTGRFWFDSGNELMKYYGISDWLVVPYTDGTINSIQMTGAADGSLTYFDDTDDAIYPSQTTINAAGTITLATGQDIEVSSTGQLTLSAETKIEFNSTQTIYESGGVVFFDDGAFEFAGGVTCGSTFTANGNTTLGDANTDTVTVNGTASFPNATSSTYALGIGGDCNLYRNSANNLKTDDSFTAANLTAATVVSNALTLAAAVGTSGVPSSLILRSNYVAAGASTHGVGLVANLLNSATAYKDAGHLDFRWIDNTSTSEDAGYQFRVMTAGAAAATVYDYGVTTAGRHTFDNALIADVLALPTSSSAPDNTVIATTESAFFVKGGVLYIAYNDSGTVHYNTIIADLTAGTTTPP